MENGENFRLYTTFLLTKFLISKQKRKRNGIEKQNVKQNLSHFQYINSVRISFIFRWVDFVMTQETCVNLSFRLDGWGSEDFVSTKIILHLNHFFVWDGIQIKMLIYAGEIDPLFLLMSQSLASWYIEKWAAFILISFNQFQGSKTFRKSLDHNLQNNLWCKGSRLWCERFRICLFWYISPVLSIWFIFLIYSRALIK